MKVVYISILLSLFAVVANAQDARVIAELAASSEKVVKNSPFSAEAVSESIQVLADGNRIVHTSSNKLYRNGDGRFRREFSNGSGGVLGSTYSFGSGITILDPVAGYRYSLDPNSKLAHQAIITPQKEFKVVSSTELSERQKELVQKLSTVVATSAAGPTSVALAHAPLAAARAVGVAPTAMGGVATFSSAPSVKYESKTDDLGTQDIEGVKAAGTRTTTTIPAGAIGNERPIEIVYERWFSPELQLIVMSKHSDPRFGEQTYRLKNLTRTEPDPSLFTLPVGYKLSSDPGGVFRLKAARSDADRALFVKAAAAAGSAARPKP